MRHAAVGEQAGERAVGDRRADLGLDVVADARDARGRELARPTSGRTTTKHGHAVDERHAGVEAGLGVVLGRLLRADRHVADEDLGAGLAQHLGDVDRLGVRRGSNRWCGG